MVDNRQLVEISADSMASEFAHRAITVCLAEGGDGVADGIERHTWCAFSDALLQHVICHFHQPPALTIHLSDQEGTRGIAMKSVQEDRDVNVNDVAVDKGA